MTMIGPMNPTVLLVKTRDKYDVQISYFGSVLVFRGIRDRVMSLQK